MSDPIKITINHELLKNVNITESNKQIHDIQASVRDITEQAKKLYSIDFVNPMQESIARLREASIKPLLFPTDVILNSTQELSRQIRALVLDYATINKRIIEQIRSLSAIDFRIGVVGQRIENRLNDNLEESAEYFNNSFEKFTERTSDSFVDSQQSDDDGDEVNEKRDIIINMTVNVYKEVTEVKHDAVKEEAKGEKPASKITDPFYKFLIFVNYFGLVIGTIEHIDTVRHLLNWFWSLITK